MKFRLGGALISLGRLLTPKHDRWSPLNGCDSVHVGDDGVAGFYAGDVLRAMISEDQLYKMVGTRTNW